mgnify:CR=1 FL=1|tara:strand:+ start:104 stop:1036 length:933 start_codon:yes stop_codon:yes gene_type:complete
MSISIVFRGPKARNKTWRKLAVEAIPDLKWYVWPDVPAPETVEALITWLPPKDYQQLFPNLKAVFSVGIGVNQFSPSTFPAHIKLVKMVDPNINTMIESYALSSVFMLHRDQFHYIKSQQNAKWLPLSIKLPSDCHIGIMGLGNLGQSVANKLIQCGFQVSGWNRSIREIDGMSTYVGIEQLSDFMSSLDIVICLLPLTDETRGIFNADMFSKLPKGAAIINLGRGEHLIETDLIKALDTEQLGFAILDVFEKEPLPPAHPFWCHPKVHITPHIAAVTCDQTAGVQLTKNLQRLINKQSLIGEIDKMKGY